ncbi:MAG: FIVAR domain-containing protein [Oscillospiraceae bacterium]|jgi:hypothetical protein|nr:FIVAR domain-containing protein [Oscillospiraceae bacterium]
MKLKELFRSKRNRVIAAVMAGAITVTSLAIGLQATLAAKADLVVNIPAPTNGYLTIEKGDTRSQTVGNLFEARVSNANATVEITKGTSVNNLRTTGAAAGTVTTYYGTKAGVVNHVNYQITNSANITKYVLALGGEGTIAKVGGTMTVPITTFVTPAGQTTPVENAGAKSSIKWSTLRPGDTVASVNANTGVITGLSKGVTAIIGEFTDKWGVTQHVHFLVAVAVNINDSDLGRLLDLINKAEETLALNPNPYTTDSLDKLSEELDKAKDALDSTNQNEIAQAADDLEQALKDLEIKQTTPPGSGGIFDDGNGNYYKKISDPKNIYMVVDENGDPKNNPPEYVYDDNSDGDDNPTTNANPVPAYPNGGYFYVEDPANSNIYKKVNSDGSLKDSPAIWGGEDGKFGGGDDKTVVLYGGNYYVDMGQNVFREVQSPLVLGPLVGGGPDENPETYAVTPIFDNTAKDGKYYVGPLGPYSDGNWFFYGDKQSGGDGLLNSTADTRHSTDAIYYYANGGMSTTPPTTQPDLPEIPGLDDANVGSTITIDGVDWIVLQKTTLNNEKYTMLLRKGDAGTVSSFSTTSQNYEGSTVQNACTARFTNAYFTPDVIQQHAVVPTLGTHTSTTAVSAPTATLAAGVGQVKDIEFALSYKEADTLMSSTLRASFGHRWFLRTADTTNQTNVWYVQPAGGINAEHYSIGVLNNVYLHPAVWVKNGGSNSGGTFNDTRSSELAGKAVGDVVVIDGIEWMIASKSGDAPQPIWFLILYDPTVCGKSVFGTNSTYEGSTLQTYLTDWYTSQNMPRLKQAAKALKLGNNGGVGIIGEAGSKTKDILVTLDQLGLWNISGSGAGSPMAKQILTPKTAVNYWTSTAKTADTNYYITGTGDVFSTYYTWCQDTQIYARPVVCIDYMHLPALV